jgi:gas vesicle protein
MYDRDDSAPTLLSFLIGGAIGATLICLLAPESGIALRQRIRRGMARGARKGRQAAGRVAEAGRAFAGEASEVLIGEGEPSRTAGDEGTGVKGRTGGRG